MTHHPRRTSRRRAQRALLAAIGVALVTAAILSTTAAARSAATPPSNTALPTISGFASRGSTLTASPGSWTGDAPISFTYAWQRCNTAGASCAAIKGATAPTYTITSGSVGARLRVSVGASNAAGVSAALSAATATIVAVSGPVNTALPTISGTGAEGQTLTLSPGTWTGAGPITFRYQWLRCDSAGNRCTDASNMITTNTITLTSADVGKTMRGVVAARDNNGPTRATSQQTAVILAHGPGNTSVPTISGTPAVGQTLTLNVGSWSGPTPITFVYQWKRCDAAGNACTDASSLITTNTISLTAADNGKTIRGVVYARSPSSATTAATSSPSAVVAAVLGPVGATRLPDGRISVPAASLSLPVRLLISNVKFTPARLSGRGQFTLKVSVTDSAGHVVRDALVLATTIPYGWANQPAEARTGTDGTVVFNLRPTARMPIRNAALLTFVRARKSGDNVLGGISTRRLVQVSIG